MSEEQKGTKGAWEKLNEIAMELQEDEQTMDFMDEYAQKFYRMAKEEEKSFQSAMARDTKQGNNSDGNDGNK